MVNRIMRRWPEVSEGDAIKTRDEMDLTGVCCRLFTLGAIYPTEMKETSIPSF